jgi:hypothetical protein
MVHLAVGICTASREIFKLVIYLEVVSMFSYIFTRITTKLASYLYAHNQIMNDIYCRKVDLNTRSDTLSLIYNEQINVITTCTYQRSTISYHSVVLKVRPYYGNKRALFGPLS